MNKVLKQRKIPVAVLRNNYINGIGKYNYEKFMVDFINNSKLFDEKEGLLFTIKKSKVIQRRMHLMDFMILILKFCVSQNKCTHLHLIVCKFTRQTEELQRMQYPKIRSQWVIIA